MRVVLAAGQGRAGVETGSFRLPETLTDPSQVGNAGPRVAKSPRPARCEPCQRRHHNPLATRTMLLPTRTTMATRVQVYVPDDTLQLLEAARPQCQSRSQWLALMAHLGIQRYQQLHATDHAAGNLTRGG